MHTMRIHEQRPEQRVLFGFIEAEREEGRTVKTEAFQS